MRSREKKCKKLHRVVRLADPEGGEGPLLKGKFFWTFHEQIHVLPVFADSVALTLLFYSSEKPSSFGMIPTSLLFHPHLEAVTSSSHVTF